MNSLHLYTDTRVYVYCPAGAVTGGAELLHQLVHTLNTNGGNAYVVYYGEQPHTVPADYAKYTLQLADALEDSPNNVAVIYEGYFKKAFEIKAAQIVLWWLSVDNFYLCQANHLRAKDLLGYNFGWALPVLAKRIVKILLGRKPEFRFSLQEVLRLNVVCNAYQSEYASDFLTRNKATSLYPLKDYINDENFTAELNTQRDDLVLYNPRKGYPFTRKLIQHSPQLQWVPIQGMNRSQVLALMRKSKVYVDFGFHPGKDRLPREAAMNGCCIVTGKKGSAGFYGDISISDTYKFDQKKADISLIIAKIEQLVHQYSLHTEDFTLYRDRIRAEKAEFEQQACHLFIKREPKEQ
jgi:hypothetical protein